MHVGELVGTAVVGTKDGVFVGSIDGAYVGY
jgi:hypothetical protein